MSVLIRDRNTVRKAGEYASYPVGAGVKVYAGSMVCIGADGYAVPGADTAGLKFVGVARAYADNTAGAAGALSVEVWRRGSFELSASGMAAGNVGDSVCVVDDQTVALTAGTTNHIPCGRVSEFNSAASVYVDIERF